MNALQFGRLIHSIYSRNGRLPDLDWIQSQGLFAVKLAQIHALRIDFLEREKCEHLARLYRQAKEVSSADFFDILRKSAPADFEEQFDSIEQSPLATASVGQVHRGELKSGEAVVIKAIKEEVTERFKADVSGIKRLIRFSTWVYPKLKKAGDPMGIIEDIERFTLSELDLRREVQGQQTLRGIHAEASQHFDLSRLVFPHVHSELCHKNLMVSEFIEGPTFDELLSKGKLDYDQLLDLFRIQGYYMFCRGVFHGDLHPGNVILSNGRFVFVDTGFIAEVGRKMRVGLFNFFAGLSKNDYGACAKSLNSMSEVEIQGEQFRKFTTAFEDLYEKFTGATVSQISLTQQMMKTIKLGIHSGMTFERGIFSIIRSLMYLDGMVLRCNPNAILLNDMGKFIGEFKKHL